MYRSIYYAVDNLPHDKKIDTRNKTHPVYDINIAEVTYTYYIYIFFFPNIYILT